MLRNYIKVFARSSWKNRTHFAINLTGLIVGFVSCILIGLFIHHELNYDRFQVKGNRIVRVLMEYGFEGGGPTRKAPVTGTKVAPALIRNFPEIESGVRMFEYGQIVLDHDKPVTEQRFMFADSSLFSIFSFKLLAGNSKTALSGSYKVILTQSAARKYFGASDPIGKTLIVGIEKKPYQVTGLMADLPEDSQIKFDFLASFSSWIGKAKLEYFSANYTTFLLLHQGTDRPRLMTKINAFMKKELAGEGATIKYTLEPFESIHLHSEFDSFEPNTSITYIYILGVVAVFILLIAAFTYINLSTARSLERAREVGVRKVSGAGSKQLFWQFIAESTLICFIAMLLSLIVALILLPSFNQLADRHFAISSLFSAPVLLGCLGTIVIVSLTAGVYPAFMLAGFRPVQVLKGSFRNTGSGLLVGRSLTVFQFLLSVFLITCTLVIRQQLDYIQHKKLGFDRDHVLVLPMMDALIPKLDPIKHALLSNKDVISVSRCESTPVHIAGGYAMRSAIMPEKTELNVTANPVDEDFLKTAGLTLASGQNFNHEDALPEDTATGTLKKIHYFVINESAARLLGWSALEAVGKKMYMQGQGGYVKGVVKDFHFESMRNEIKPLVLFPENRAHYLLLRISGSNIPATIAYAGNTWKTFAPGIPFEYHFLDEDFDKLYSAEIRLGEIMNIFAMVAIILACLGLFGLSSYAIQQRFKEIGIRKVCGASVTSITALLSGNFLSLVIIAVVIAIPVAWVTMHNYLRQFSYHITPGWELFALAGTMALLIAFVTVSFQSVRTALINPVDSLRND